MSQRNFPHTAWSLLNFNCSLPQESICAKIIYTFNTLFESLKIVSAFSISILIMQHCVSVLHNENSEITLRKLQLWQVNTRCQKKCDYQVLQLCNDEKTQGKLKEPQLTAAFPFKCAFGSTAVHIASGNPAKFTIIATAAIISTSYRRE